MNQIEFNKKLEDLKNSSAIDISFLTSWYEETIEQLSSLSEQCSQISHPRYRGDSREDAFISLLKDILPSSVEISNGFVMNEYSTKSYEQDCLLLNKEFTATFVKINKAVYYPIESVLGSVEIKSKLNLSELRKTVLNCISLKKLSFQHGLSEGRSESGEHSEIGYFIFAYDSTWNLESTCKKLNDLLKDVPPSLRPNMVYVLKKGFLLPSSNGAFRIGPQGMFGGESFSFQEKMGTKNIPKSDAPPFLWFLSNMIDHCMSSISTAKVPWYGKYIFSPLALQSNAEKQMEDSSKKN
ncbi:hypothetical protein TW85_21860 [Marinomonas sp. S3726]|uniref:DUF6602 domain-containing protein n=1 Tax=Marinomonas sp. S3726 TaxID=579484 RepID=UPI0005F9C28E|nr:DUF6602 domain-containing protein [Marinomonas sp. S3726]KJZ09590.1 hypothetical protein TW85_21860 [Marinomonas sp. S3726]